MNDKLFQCLVGWVINWSCKANKNMSKSIIEKAILLIERYKYSIESMLYYIKFHGINYIKMETLYVLNYVFSVKTYCS